MFIKYPADIRPLTSLRFFAAAIIVIWHLGYFIPSTYKNFSGLMDKGYLAVDFFFILSGFILTHAYHATVEQKTFSARDFYIRRLARIYPVHLFTLLIMAALCLTPMRFGPVTDWPGHFPITTFLHHLLLVQAWGVDAHVAFNAPSWSISAEWFAYLTFPLLLPSMLSIRPGRLLISLSLLFAAVWLIWLTKHPLQPLTSLTAPFSIPRIMPEFALGMALYLYTSKLLFRPAWPGLLLGACAVIAALLLHCRAPDVCAIPLFMLMIYSAAEITRGKTPYSWLAGRTAVWLGEISFALYMVHYIVLTLILGSSILHFPHAQYISLLPLLLPASLLATFAAAAITHHAIELPARHFLNRHFTRQHKNSETHVEH